MKKVDQRIMIIIILIIIQIKKTYLNKKTLKMTNFIQININMMTLGNMKVISMRNLLINHQIMKEMIGMEEMKN